MQLQWQDGSIHPIHGWWFFQFLGIAQTHRTWWSLAIFAISADFPLWSHWRTRKHRDLHRLMSQMEWTLDVIALVLIESREGEGRARKAKNYGEGPNKGFAVVITVPAFQPCRCSSVLLKKPLTESNLPYATGKICSSHIDSAVISAESMWNSILRKSGTTAVYQLFWWKLINPDYLLLIVLYLLCINNAQAMPKIRASIIYIPTFYKPLNFHYYQPNPNPAETSRTFQHQKAVNQLYKLLTIM